MRDIAIACVQFVHQHDNVRRPGESHRGAGRRKKKRQILHSQITGQLDVRSGLIAAALATLVRLRSKFKKTIEIRIRILTRIRLLVPFAPERDSRLSYPALEDLTAAVEAYVEWPPPSCLSTALQRFVDDLQ